ncbi:helix-turn-helix domain-containing protein [Flavisolibacter ginsenosidimutans]|uniref:AAA family ATPase n=2 Tax=Flavisolibacter ginsenosidimutans TaxID=661481 RepID=A0A5B8UPE1_9BACT|nr:AAA family ATPase [Flavisolibacter ginsenosidimutans]
MQHDSTNTVFSLAADLVNHTSRHLFLTGKAGTGKTTFLKYIKDTTKKNTVIVAPTGVAAINASGVTMHSFFQLPFGPFVPASTNLYNGNGQATDKHSLFKNIFFTSSKRELLQELELLIIDEVSMVRADMLDAMDVILRHFRKKYNVPFGGVQVVYIGDLFQLPPVVQQQEWAILSEHYESPFFFDAKVVKESPPLYIELKKIYRQNEQHFIDILNRIRNNIANANDLAELNNRYNPSFNPPAEEKYITLSTHNRKADVINEAELKKLPGNLHMFTAEVTGEFSDKALPTEMNLQLKEGAQVMFVKNDSGTERRYFNGKLAIVKKISNDEITVSFDDGEDLKLEKETWKNIRYNYDKEKGDIDEEELGSFKQYPIRLAWAITIHKSQGLTFNKAVIDAGSSFAAGQVYVALSRCTSLEGLVLHSKIFPHVIATDKRVLAFAEREADDEYLEQLLKEEKEKFQAEVLVKTFNWDKVILALHDWLQIIPGKKLPDTDETLRLCQDLIKKAIEQREVASKFQNQLRSVLQSGDKDLLQQRVNKAVLYFAKQLVDDIIVPLQQHLASLRFASKVVKYTKELRVIEGIILQQLDRLNSIAFGDLVFVQYEAPVVKPQPDAPKSFKKEKLQKGASHRDTLQLYREGKTLQEIASLRNLTVNTIEGHLATFIYSGDLELDELVPPSKSKVILAVIDNAGMTATSIKQRLSDEFSFGEIRAVMNWHRLQQEQKKQLS